jgi:hypothetical protein
VRRALIGLVLLAIIAALLIGLRPKEEVHEENRQGPSWYDIMWKSYPELGEGAVTYEYSPINENIIMSISPLGHIFHHTDGTPGHPLPTDHTYWFSDGMEKVVRAPARGVITRISVSGDYSVTITHTNTFKSVFGHIYELYPSILSQAGDLKTNDEKEVYIPVEAGQEIGIVRGVLDFGAYDKNVTLSFIHPERYGPLTRHTVSPLDYFKEPLRSFLYSKTEREAEPRGGKIDFDEPGKLVGNWFIEGTGESWEENWWKKPVAFVYDFLDPRYLRVSLGAETLRPYGGLFAVKGNGPDFKDIDVNSGEIVYKLMATMEGIERLHELYPDRWLYDPNYFRVDYTLLVKMIDNERIKLEVFPGDVDNPSFTEKAKYYVR